MDLVYSMRRKPLKCAPPNFDEMTDPEAVRPICTISISNIIAFTSFTELSDAEGDTWAGHVYVCDLNTPWNSHKVTSTVHPVSALEWDGEGKNLLVATTVGDISVYGQKDYLLNEWTCLYSAKIPGEKVIKAIFFHNGRRVLPLDKKSEVPVTERYQMLRNAPTLKGFGGVGCEGACAVTSSGLLAALTPAPGARAALLAAAPLRPARDLVTAAAFAHKNGGLVVAACGARGGRRGVRVAAVAASRARAPEPVALRVTPLPTLYLPDDAAHVAAPVSISWSIREEMDSLLIASNTLSMWKLTERAYPPHKLLSKGGGAGGAAPGGPKAASDCFTSLSWQQTGAWPMESGELGTCVASCRPQPGAPLAVLATPRALHLLGDSHHYLCSRPVVTGAEASPPAPSPPKKAKYGPGALPSGARGARVGSVAVSWSASAAVALDSHSQLHVFRIHPADLPGQPALAQLAAQLELALVRGADSADVLLTLKPSVLEALYERITESFQRQPQQFQQHYHHAWLRLRIQLCSMIPTAQASASNLTSLLMCAATSAACAGALRSDDKLDGAAPAAPAAPAAALQALLDDPSEHDKNLLALEAKAEAFGEAAAAALLPLQALRRPLQRALHTALTALAALQPAAAPHGYELWADPAALALLRKLVVVCRASARGAGGAGGAGEAGAALQGALARLAAAPHAVKPDLIEECLTLSAQRPARVWEARPRCGLLAPHARPGPFYFEYGVEPEALRFVPEPPPHAVSEASPSFDMDAIRYMYLGGGDRGRGRWRECGRCGARALPAAHCARHPLQRAHDARFVAACRCGGKWTLISNI